MCIVVEVNRVCTCCDCNNKVCSSKEILCMLHNKFIVMLHSTCEDEASLNKYISFYTYFVLLVFFSSMHAHVFYVNDIEFLLRRFHIYEIPLICVFFVWQVVDGFKDTSKKKLYSHVCVCVGP